MALNETLSPRQAKQIGKQYEMIVNQTVKDIQQGFSNFFLDMQNEWEDKYAVDLSKELKDAMDQVTTHLQENSNKFVDTINHIAKAYADTGGITTVGEALLEYVRIDPLQIVANIKETFDGDMFGFKNVDSHDRIAESISKLVTKLNSIIGETSSRLRGINAFGNPEVIANISVSGGRIIEILQDAVKDVEEATKKNLEQAANAYKGTGSKAADAANIKKAS